VHSGICAGVEGTEEGEVRGLDRGRPPIRNEHRDSPILQTDRVSDK
jgi:hypothetical protein